MNKCLTQFFGFQAAGVMLRSDSSNELFTSVNKSPDDICDNVDDYVYFPMSVGLTGAAVKSQSITSKLTLSEVIICNSVLKDMRFNTSTDNIANVHEPRQLMICPIIDFEEDMDSLKIGSSLISKESIS